MTPVRVLHVSAVQALEYRDQLIDAGLIMNHDFEWEYQPPRYDSDSYLAATPKQAVFRFWDPALATFYQLKWTKS